MPRVATARYRLLTAGRKALLASGYRILDSGLTVESVAREAGLTSQTFYSVYPSNQGSGRLGGKQKFLDELMASLVVDSPRATQKLLRDQIGETLIENKGDPRKAIREVCAWDYQQVLTDEATMTRLFIASLGRDHPAALQAVRDEYKEINRYGREAYEATLTYWGAALRKPFTPDSVAVLFTAIVEGLVIRELLDPGAVPDGLFGNAILALTSALVDLDQEHSHLDELIEPLAEQVMRDFRIAQADNLPDNPRQAIIDAARQEFGVRGYHATSFSHIATVAGVDMMHLKRMFPSKPHIILGALRPVFDQLKSATEDDTNIGITGTAALTRFIRRLTTSAFNEKAMFDALMLAISDTSTRDLDSPDHIKNEINFPAIIAPVVRAAQASGEFNNTVDGGEVAVTITNLVLMRAFTTRGESAEDVAKSLSGLLLAGLEARSSAA